MFLPTMAVAPDIIYKAVGDKSSAKGGPGGRGAAEIPVFAEKTS